MHNCDAEEGRSDESMVHGDGTLYTWRGFVAIGRHTGDVGGMVGRGIICKDFLPHSLFGWGVVIQEGGVPVIRSIGYLHLSAPEVRLVLKFHPGGCPRPSPLISNEIYGR